MIAELGHFALMLALPIALVQGVWPLLGAHQGDRSRLALARPSAWLQFGLVSTAYLLLTWSFVTNDFSVAYVAQHSNSRLPLAYRVAGVWGGHEGSLLLWSLMMAGWTVAVALRSRTLGEIMAARVIAVMGLISAGFLAFILLTSNPFLRVLPGLDEGRDLNPLLQDPGLIFHPPLLYMGYVGFSVAFAFAIAALLSGRLDAAWARFSRPWTTAAWLFLTLGIALGSYWAYYELGWGGWWFWDPVENASFMPWLVGTALMHSLSVTEKRGAFRNWTVLLAILAFSLSLLGTFLVRSGVLSSVHAFATDPRRGLFILALIVIVVTASLLLFAWRAPKVGLGGRFSLLSRETFLLVNNVLLLVAAATVLLGTLYPLFIDALGMGKLSVGPPYFNAVFVPLMLPVLFLIGVGPAARWKSVALPMLAKIAAPSLVLAVVLAAGATWLSGTWQLTVWLGLSLAFWILLAGVRNAYPQLRRGGGSASFWGMHLAHAGVAVFVIGVTLVEHYETERDVRMAVGDEVTIGGNVIRFAGASEVEGPNYLALRGTLEVSRDGRRVDTLFPEKRIYHASSMPMTEAAIRTSITGDLYASMGEALEADPLKGAWAVRVYYKPFVSWIWSGCLLMALGGLAAVADRRYRVRRNGGASP